VDRSRRSALSPHATEREVRLLNTLLAGRFNSWRLVSPARWASQDAASRGVVTAHYRLTFASARRNTLDTLGAEAEDETPLS
jgi:hypothetical protein